MSKVNDQIAALYARRRAQIEEGKGLILSTLRKHGGMYRPDIRKAAGLSQDVFRTAMAELYSEKKLWSVNDGTIEAAGEVAQL